MIGFKDDIRWYGQSIQLILIPLIILFIVANVFYYIIDIIFSRNYEKC